MRWPWSRKRKEPDGEWWEKVAQLEGRQKALELEWEDTFESIKRSMAKLGKRAKALQDAPGSTNGDEEGSQVGGTLRGAPPSEYGRRLTAARHKYGRS